eukprot:TRINITY_DN17749_c0_g2_i3.p1 TRINITY_DN17749_c0_g2~~TRINITY_DN17749_c0_g2_i3.p1  ORF type:complete len:108 (-),score=6.21 TRINITY_DN17749_c0_g2_i3:25-348(-)
MGCPLRRQNHMLISSRALIASSTVCLAGWGNVDSHVFEMTYEPFIVNFIFALVSTLSPRRRIWIETSSPPPRRCADSLTISLSAVADIPVILTPPFVDPKKEENYSF